MKAVVLLLLSAWSGCSGWSEVRPVNGEVEVRGRSLCDNDPEAYAPCYCDESSTTGRSVTCDRVSTAAAVTAAFVASGSRDHATFTVVENGFAAVPAYLLGPSARAQNIQLRCAGKSLGPIDDDAFRSSSLYTTSFGMDRCVVDLFTFNFEFLAGFNALAELTLTRMGLLTFNNPPQFNALRTINLQQVDNFVGLYAPQPASVLEDVVIRNMADEDVVITVLDSLSTYTSTMKSINFEGTRLNRIPAGIRSFGQLEELRLGNNSISYLAAQSLNWPAKLKYLGLNSNGLSETSLSAPSFASDFSETLIDLSGNNFKTFTYNTFHALLRSMTSGSIQLHASATSTEGNRVNCDCLLAWLIKDCRDLLPKVQFGLCSNGTRFENLNPNGSPIAGCPVQCTSSPGNTTTSFIDGDE